VVPSDGGYLARDSPMLVFTSLRLPAVEEEVHREVTDLQCILPLTSPGATELAFPLAHTSVSIGPNGGSTCLGYSGPRIAT
jgi:hypothetical protein